MKLLEQLRHRARVKHLSYRTEQAYVYWAERYIASTARWVRKASTSVAPISCGWRMP